MSMTTAVLNFFVVLTVNLMLWQIRKRVDQLEKRARLDAAAIESTMRIVNDIARFLCTPRQPPSAPTPPQA